MDIKYVLECFTTKKIPWDDIGEENKKGYNPFLINLWLSMEPSLIEIINEVQRYQVPNKDHYNFYLQVLPKRKLYFRWLKAKSKKYNKDVVNKLAAFYNEGSQQIYDSLECLDEQKIINILEQTGLGEKQIKQLLK